MNLTNLPNKKIEFDCVVVFVSIVLIVQSKPFKTTQESLAVASAIMALNDITNVIGDKTGFDGVLKTVMDAHMAEQALVETVSMYKVTLHKTRRQCIHAIAKELRKRNPFRNRIYQTPQLSALMDTYMEVVSKMQVARETLRVIKNSREAYQNPMPYEYPDEDRTERILQFRRILNVCDETRANLV